MILDVAGAAQLLAVSPDTVRELARRREIPTLPRLGPRWRFSDTGLIRWFERKALRNLRGYRPPGRDGKPAEEASYATRRARLVRTATPPWASLGAIERLYEKARRLTKRTGERHHVDHIIPLQGRTVCGLHVEQNLRVVPAIFNLRRRRIFEPETS